MLWKRLGPTRPGFWRCASCGTPNPEAGYLTHCLGCGSPRAASEVVPPRRRPVGRLGRAVGIAAWAYAAGLAIVWAVQAGLGDRWWGPTFLLYGPRWVWGLPLAFLVPAAIRSRPRSLVALAVAAVLLVGPVMGGRVPWRRAFAGGLRGTAIRVLSCNVLDGSSSAMALGDLIDRERPDVVALQEWDDSARSMVFRGLGWHVRVAPGMCVGSRFPIVEAGPIGTEELGWRAMVLRCRLATPLGEVVVDDVHFETPREGLEAVLRDGWRGIPKLREVIDWRRRVAETIPRLAREGAGPRSLVVGDFNLTDDSPLFRRGWSSYRDAFAEAGWGFGFTKFTRWIGARIDHVLTAEGFVPIRCRVGPDVGSDHRPLIADFSLTQ